MNKIFKVEMYIDNVCNTKGITHISECGNNKRKTAGGYVWKSRR